MRFVHIPAVCAVALILAASLVAGCARTARPLMPTPTLYQESAENELFAATPAERQATGLTLLYITNRSPMTDPESRLPYGESRSHLLAYGSAVVELGPDLDWLSVEQQSHLADRTSEVNLELGAVQELGRFPQEPYPVVVTSTGVGRSAPVVRQHEEAKAGFQAELQRYLAHSPSKEVFLYVHGFKETFASAAYTTADLCHFLGREHVCAFFTWPASTTGGFLTAYTTTTESAEYAVGHLRKTIRMIAQTPGVQGVHLLAHSRGTVLLVNAFNELALEAIAFGLDPAQHLNLVNFILMAPDIDVDVALQKLMFFESDPDLLTHWPSEQIPDFLRGRLTVYSSPGDRALGVSEFLFRSRSRVGQVGDQIPQERQKLVEAWGRFDLIVYKGTRTDRFGHSYFVSNPRVSSDLIALLRFGTKPGEAMRPLKQVGPVVWTFPED